MGLLSRAVVAAVAVISTLALAACSAPASTPASASASTAATAAGTWPKTVTHDAGTTEIPAAPLRIVSTSPSITGSLLAIDAPLVGSGAATVTALTDDKGFFKQWASVADQRGVEVVYANLTMDLDAIESFRPDLIIGSSNGGDSSLESYAQLSEIAPTILLNYGTMTWQQLTTELGSILGRDAAATSVIAEYDAWVAEQAKAITVPEQPVTVLVYLGADGVWAYTSDTPQAKLLESVGFQYADAKAEFSTTTPGAGTSVVSAENMPAALAGAQSLFVVPISGDAAVTAFASDALVSTLPAVTGNRVFNLGSQSFRLDYYSAKATVESLRQQFGA